MDEEDEIVESIFSALDENSGNDSSDSSKDDSDSEEEGEEENMSSSGLLVNPLCTHAADLCKITASPALLFQHVVQSHAIAAAKLCSVVLRSSVA
jgi:hypothetical protein